MNDCWTKVAKSPLNISKSKMLYSFNKSPRFHKQDRSSSCQKIYDLPPLMGHSPKAAIGYGNKSQLVDKDTLSKPAPGKYNIKSIFEDCKKGYNFGVGRENLKLGGIFKKSESPGPAAYTVSVRDHSPEITLKPRTKQLSPMNYRNPGPGAYNLPAYLNEKGKYQLSNVKNSSVPIFKDTKSMNSLKKIQMPGPGAYQTKQNFHPKGTYFNSKFPNSMARTFGKLERQDKSNKENRVGPGSYNILSEFGAK